MARSMMPSNSAAGTTGQMKVHGLQDLQKKLQLLPKEIAGKGASGPLAAATREAAKEWQKEAQQRAPKKTGRLARAIKVRREKDPQKFPGRPNELYHVGVDVGRKRDDPNGAWYWWFVENGTKGAVAGVSSHGGSGRPTKTGKTVLSSGDKIFGKSVRGQAARPFLRPAFDQASGKVLITFQKRLSRRIELIEKKLGSQRLAA